MLTTAPGSVDGIRVTSFEADQEYDLSATDDARELASAFVGAGLAREVGAMPELSKTVALVDGEGAGASVPSPPDAPAPAKPGRKTKA